DDLERIRTNFGLEDYWPDSPPHLDGARKGELVSLSGTPLVSIPIVGSAAAGGGIFNVDPDRNTVDVPRAIAFQDTLGYVIDGDSMMPFLEEFDTAVFRKAGKKVSGYVYLIKLPQNGYAVKLVSFERGDWYLVSINDKYPPKLVPQGTEFLGILVGYYRVRGTMEIFQLDKEGLRPYTY
ncbi:S24 family peptidase, partial [bacterium]